ncbi:hypothetical protein CFO_g4043 [Ceratocystis platani]|uniref:Uncharacterized protein n=1 Tax=Ceratocystis fimbriata f. sp. platani TaxID=88771 RepID=A0A0F8AYY6_CERFI|nr:hypothetical protein CFO_g4043 [Ceratocystis platani]
MHSELLASSIQKVEIEGYGEVVIPISGSKETADTQMELFQSSATETFHNGVPDEAFTTTIRKVSEEVARPISEFFPTEEPELEMWQFGWYEDRFARATESKSIVNVASKIYRRIHIKDPGEYEVTLAYSNGETTVANWVVRPIFNDRKAKNVILFIGDGHQMTHSIDTTMTDSANSVSALYSGHKGCKTMEQLNNMDILDETEIIVTADHGHNFDRNVIGVYGQSGESQYTKPVAGISYGTGPNFPMSWGLLIASKEHSTWFLLLN